ncbi:hypothetical protein BASA62_003973 [Batrachochytrium salamandrivorans]|nr:hypothetical protein BASA62_003973 [Batrachochytrium salamandrivorans]
MYIDTGSHQTKNNNKSTLGQTKVAALKKTHSSLKNLPKAHLNRLPLKKESKFPQKTRTKPTETTKKPFQWSKLKGNNGSSKGGSLEPKESTQGSSKLSNISDDDGPKPLQDPPTQKQSGGAINAPKVGSNRGSSGPTGAAVGPNGAISTDGHQAKDNKDSTLGQTKGADSSTPNSSALEDIDPDLPGELIDPQEKKRPIPTPTPSKPTPEVTTVHEFLALDNPKVPLSHRQEIAFKLFSLLNKPVTRDGKVYLLTKINTPEKERIEQESMVAYFGSTYQIKQETTNLRECEKKIFSFPTSGPSLASKYSEAKKSQTKAVKRESLTDDDEGQKLIDRCLTIRGQFLSAQSKSKQAWLELTEEQRRFYDYIKPVTKNMIFQLGM